MAELKQLIVFHSHIIFQDGRSSELAEERAKTTKVNVVALSKGRG